MYAAWLLESPVAVKKFGRVEDSLHEARPGGLAAEQRRRVGARAGGRLPRRHRASPRPVTSPATPQPPLTPQSRRTHCRPGPHRACARLPPAHPARPQVEMYLLLGSHDNIVALRGLCQHDGCMYLVLEYCPRRAGRAPPRAGMLLPGACWAGAGQLGSTCRALEC